MSNVNIKTNFSFLDKVIKIDKNGKIINNEIGVTTNNIVNFKILKTLIDEIEYSLYIREYGDKKLVFRNVIELMNKYFYSEISKTDFDLVSSERVMLNSMLYSEWIKAKDNAEKNNNKWKIHHLLNALEKTNLINFEFKENVFEFVKNVNKEVHIIDENNLEHKINGYFLSNNTFKNSISFKEYVKLIEKLHEIILKFFIILYPEIDFSNVKFDVEIYNDGRESFVNIKNKDQFIKLLGEECLICNKGRLNIPKDNTYINGPFLICDNCSAILSTNLNLKENSDVNIECTNSDCKGKYKKTAGYIEGEPNYRKPFLQCNHCKEFGE